MKKILSLLFLGILFFGYNKVSYANSDIIIDYIEPELSLEFIEKNSFDSFFKDPSVPEYYGTNRPLVSWSLSYSGYSFGVHTDNSTIYSNYYFKEHNGRLNFQLPESSGPNTKYYKFYLYEHSTNNVVAELSVKKGTTVSFALNNLNTSKNYYFGIKPNGSTIIIDGKVWR